jgi:hypothetical protein
MSVANDQTNKEQYLNHVYSQFCKNEKTFFDEIYYKALSQMLGGVPNVEIELMDLSDLILEHSRGLDENNKDSLIWRRLAFSLRRISQRIFIKHNCLTKDSRFLKLVR